MIQPEKKHQPYQTIAQASLQTGDSMPNRTVQRGTFKAFDNKGKEHNIFIFVKISDVSLPDEPGREVEGAYWLETSTGEKVNRVTKGKYFIVTTWTELTSNDPRSL